MNFFKRLFNKGKEESKESTDRASTNSKSESSGFGKRTKDFIRTDSVEYAISTDKYFEKRYKEEELDPSMIDGTEKMILGYFEANKLEPAIPEPICHPLNLDKTIDDGFGFILYCKAFKMDENMAVGILATALNHYFIDTYNFKLYHDSEPEFPLRSMTLKYDENGAKLSLYPVEYTAKVINYEATYADLYGRIKEFKANMPDTERIQEELLNDMIRNSESSKD